MEAGALKHLVSIQLLSSAQNATTGIVTPAWTELAAVWANVRPQSAKENIAAGERVEKMMAVITIRHISGIKPSMRVVHGARTYSIEGIVSDALSGTEALHLQVSEVLHG